MLYAVQIGSGIKFVKKQRGWEEKEQEIIYPGRLGTSCVVLRLPGTTLYIFQKYYKRRKNNKTGVIYDWGHPPSEETLGSVKDFWDIHKTCAGFNSGCEQWNEFSWKIPKWSFRVSFYKIIQVPLKCVIQRCVFNSFSGGFFENERHETGQSSWSY